MAHEEEEIQRNGSESTTSILWDLVKSRKWTEATARIQSHPTEARWRPNDDPETILHWCSHTGAPLDLVRLVFEADRMGAVVQETQREKEGACSTPLQWACERMYVSGDTDHRDNALLIDHYLSVYCPPPEALLRDVGNHHGVSDELLPSLLSPFLNHVLPVTKGGLTLLHLAVRGFHGDYTLHILHALLRADPAMVYARDGYGRTPLHCLVHGGGCQGMEASEMAKAAIVLLQHGPEAATMACHSNLNEADSIEGLPEIVSGSFSEQDRIYRIFDPPITREALQRTAIENDLVLPKEVVDQAIVDVVPLGTENRDELVDLIYAVLLSSDDKKGGCPAPSVGSSLPSFSLQHDPIMIPMMIRIHHPRGGPLATPLCPARSSAPAASLDGASVSPSTATDKRNIF